MLLLSVCASVFGLSALAFASDGAAASDGTMRFAMRRKQAAASGSTTLLRPLHFNNQWIPGPGGYFIDLTIGTPPQSFEVLVDTGSSNLFVASAAAKPCKEYNCPGGAFVSNLSSTFHVQKEPRDFDISYVDTSHVLGGYVSDIVSLGDAKLSNFTFALATQIQVSPGQGKHAAQYGIMGISFDGQETDACPTGTTGCPGGFLIPTVPDALHNAGYIGSRSYSLYLDDLEEQQGSILFGGIDTAKFSGELVKLTTQVDILGDAQNGTYVGQDLRLTDVAASINGSTFQLSYSNLSSTVTIDSGAAAMQLPQVFFDAINNRLPTFDYEGQLAIACNYADLDAHITIGLTGTNGKTAKINVPMENLVIPWYKGDYNSTTPYYKDGEELCVFALGSGPNVGGLLGDPFIRSAYIHYNLDEKTISLAQASYDTGSSHIVPVGPSVPSLSGTGSNTTALPANLSSSSTSSSLPARTSSASSASTAVSGPSTVTGAPSSTSSGPAAYTGGSVKDLVAPSVRSTLTLAVGFAMLRSLFHMV